MANWFYKKDDQPQSEPVGPVSTSVLTQLVRDGVLHPTSLIQHPTNTKGEWAKLKRIPGLLRRYQEGVTARNRYRERPQEKQRSPRPLASPPQIPSSAEDEYRLADEPGVRRAGEEVPASASEAAPEPTAAGEQIDLSREELATHRLEAERLLNVAHAKSQVTKFQLDGQPQPIIARVVDHVSELLAVDETIEYIAVQAKQPPEMPDCLVLTNQRLIIVHHQILGQLDHEEYRWEHLYEPRMKDGQPNAEFSLRALSGRAIVVDQLPRIQVKQSVRVAKEREEELRKRRLRREREVRAAEERGEELPALTPAQSHPSQSPSPNRIGLTESPRGAPPRPRSTPAAADHKPPQPTPQQPPPSQPTISYRALPPHLQAKWKAVDELFEIGVISQEEMEEERRNLLQTALNNRKR